MQLYFDAMESPIGTIVLVSGLHGGVRSIGLPRAAPVALSSAGRASSSVTRDASAFAKRVRAYLDGDLDSLGDVPVAGTPFQREVWAALRSIPAGTTATYGEIAARSVAPARRAPSGSRTHRTRWRSRCRAIVSSAPTARSPATAAASTASSGSSTTRPSTRDSHRHFYFAETCQPPSRSLTVAHVGAPWRSLPAYRASRRPPGRRRTFSISSQSIERSGILARRDQGVFF